VDEMTLLSNILQFKGKSFENPVTAFRYTPKEEMNWYTVGWYLRSLRKIYENRLVAIIQDGTSLYSTRVLLDGGLGLLESFNEKETKTLSIANESDRSILTKLLGESVAVTLRNQARDTWRIEEVTRAVYEVSNVDALDGFGEIAVFKGFRYQPLILGNGKAGLVIDPKFKFHSTKTFRQYNITDLPYISDEFASDSEYSQKPGVVDLCPIDDCPEKSDSFSVCLLAGTGKRVTIKGYSSVRPSEAELDLIEYHRRDKTCPQTPLLANFLTDEEPVAVVSLGISEYCYPLERLRLQPTFGLLSQEDRKQLMERVRMFPPDRFNLTEYYGGKLSLIQVEGLSDFHSMGFRKSWEEISQVSFDRPDLVLHNGKRTRFPHREIEVNGPYDLSETHLDNIIFFILYSKSDSESIPQMFIDVVVDGKSKTFIPTFEDISKKPVKKAIVRTIDDTLWPDILDEIKTLHNESVNLCVILIHSQNLHEMNVAKVESDLISAGIPKQGISAESLHSRHDNRQRGYFRNVYLGIYAKLGGTAWALPEIEDKSTIFIGHSSRFSGESYNFAECAYTNNGLFKDGRFRQVEKYSSRDAVHQVVTELSKDYKQTVLLVHGVDPVIGQDSGKSLEEKLKGELCLIEVLPTPLRLYQAEDNRILPPEIGDAVWLSNDSIGLVTTRMPFGTPDPILIRKISGSAPHFKHLIKNIFDFTECYTGYEKYSTKLPIPIHASRRTLQKAMQFDLKTLDFKEAWFV
jgi:hypothetical protein